MLAVGNQRLIEHDRTPAGSPMRVLLVVTQLEFGGAQVFAIELAARLRARGHAARTVFLYTRHEAFAEAEEVVRGAAGRNLLRIVPELVQTWRDFRPTHVLGVTYFANIAVAALAPLLGRPAVIATQHAIPTSFKPVGRWLDRTMGSTGFYDATVLCSTPLMTAFSGYPAGYLSRTRVIENGHGFRTSTRTRPEARTALDLPIDGPLVGHIGRLAPSKGQATVIEALPRLPGVTFALVGTGPDREALAALAGRLGVADRVRFMGGLDRQQIADFLKAIDVFVFPSHFEGLSLALIEAMMAGAAIVASAADTVADALRTPSGESVAPCLPHDPAVWAAEIASLLADPARRIASGATAQRLARRFDIDTMVDAYEQLFHNLDRRTAP
jgi:glycosyltransferase involved in cell wall biosynthesis